MARRPPLLGCDLLPVVPVDDEGLAAMVFILVSAAEEPGPNSLARASTYFLCFSSRSSLAFNCLAARSLTAAFRASSSLSSSSSPRLSAPTPVARVCGGFGLRLKTCTAGLKSDLRGASLLRVSTKWKGCGFSAESQSCLFSAACFALRSALVTRGCVVGWLAAPTGCVCYA